VEEMAAAFEKREFYAVDDLRFIMISEFDHFNLCSSLQVFEITQCS